MRLPTVIRALLPAVAVLLLTVANVAGARAAGKTTAWLTALPVAGLLVLFGLGVVGGGWPDAGLGGDLESAQPTANGLGASLIGLGAAMVPVFFTYSGWNAAAYVAGEIEHPARNLPRGLLLGTLGTTVFYVAFNGFLLWILPRAVMAGSTTSAAQAAQRLLGDGAEQALALLVALAVLGSANVTLMAGARIYYAMALDGLAPRALAMTNAAGVPSTALWTGGIWTALLATSGRIETLVNWATLAILLLSSLAVLALFVLRRAEAPPNGAARVYRCPGYPVTPVLYLLVALGVAVASAMRDWRQALYGVVVVAAGIPVYALLRWRQTRRQAASLPKDTVE
jgi:APA family basic amino acid/polyamine antiporter